MDLMGYLTSPRGLVLLTAMAASTTMLEKKSDSLFGVEVTNILGITTFYAIYMIPNDRKYSDQYKTVHTTWTS